MINMVKLPTNKSSLFLRVAKGHFATSQVHPARHDGQRSLGH